MGKKFISLFMLFIFTISFSIRASAYSQRNQGESEEKKQIELIAYDSLENIYEAEDMVYQADKWYKEASDNANKVKLKDSRDLYSVIDCMYVIYAEKYYSPSLVKKIESGQKELEQKLKKVEEEVTEVYKQNGGGSGAALEILRQQCEVYKKKCYELVKIFNEQKDKADESEITVAQKEIYNENTKTGFKYVGNNECVYFENGRLLADEWKRFEDGYRYFDKSGFMSHDGADTGLRLNSKGLAVDVRGNSQGKCFIPAFDSRKDLKNLTHTCRVFNLPYKVTYKDTYNKENDGKVADCSIYDCDTETYGFDTLDYTGEQNLIVMISIYKYTDRLNLLK